MSLDIVQGIQGILGEFMRKLLIAAAALLFTTAANAGTTDDDQRKFAEEQFKGWTGLVLHCAPNTGSSVVRDTICQSATAEFNYLAENSGIPHRFSDGEDMFNMTRNSYSLGTPLILEVETSSSGGNSGPIAVHVRVAAENFYTKAIQQDAKPGEPEASPRGGDLIMWESTVISAGYGEQQTARDLTPYVNDKIKAFFSEFLIGWKSKH